VTLRVTGDITSAEDRAVHDEGSGSSDDLRCRLCGGALQAETLLTIERAPQGAQAFLTSEQLSADGPITLDIRQCPDCGLVQACSPPVPNWQHVIRSGGYSPAMSELRRRQVRHFLENYPSGGRRVIEAGCGRGDLLEILRDCGATPFGLEASLAAVLAGRERGLSIEHGYPASGRAIHGGPFDAFVTSNVIEHAVDPRDFLRGLRQNLRSQAVGMVEVPSFERMLEQRRSFDFIADHLSYFTVDTLRLALEMAGFEVLEVSREWWVDDIVAFVRVRPLADWVGAQQELDAAVADIREFIDGHARDGRSVAVWGASHQALTLLALAQCEHVAYVIDSAPFKQGFFTPATHLPVVAPAHVALDPPAAILVMAAGYSDEVVHSLRDGMRYRGVIGVLRGNRVELVDGLEAGAT
jgi:SAM-dependent methyltransferase